MTRNVLFFMLLGMLLVFISGCSKDDDLEVKTGIAARIGDTKLTTDEVDKRFEQLGADQRGDFKGKRGKVAFVDKLIEEQIIYEEALTKKLDRDRDIKGRIEKAKKAILISEYYRKEIVDKVNITDAEIKEYYNTNQEEFRTRALIKAHHIFSTDSMKAVEWKKRLDAGENFSKIAKEESEDSLTALNNGNLGYFNPGSYIKFVGFSDAFSKAVEVLERGEISDVIAFEKGYSIVWVREKKPESILSLADARTRIIDRLKGKKASEAFQEEIRRLKKKYEPTNYLREELAKSVRSPEEFWEIAQEESDPYERIQYYRDLVNYYPDHKYAPQALFMIGFVYMEEVQNLVEGRRTFDELIRKYPDSEVIESAKWMIENMNRPHPKFESLEDVKKKMEEERTEGEERE